MSDIFSQELLAACAREREVDLTTWGRVSGRPSRVTLWIASDGRRLFVRSGGGMGRDWPRNLIARGAGVLHAGGIDAKVRARHIADPAQARAVSALLSQKYGADVQCSRDDEPLTPGESACFELLPEDAHGE